MSNTSDSYIRAIWLCALFGYPRYFHAIKYDDLYTCIRIESYDTLGYLIDRGVLNNFGIYPTPLTLVRAPVY